MTREKYAELLTKLLDGKISRAEKKEFLAATKKDPELAEQYRLALKLQQTGRNRTSHINPATSKLSQALFSDFIKNQASKITYAVRTYDSSFLPLPEGVRPASVDTRSIKYKLGTYHIELTVYPITVDSIEIIGRIEGTPKNATISLKYSSREFTDTISADTFNLFRFERVPAEQGLIQISVNDILAGILELKND